MTIPRNLGNFADNINPNGKVEVTGINATGTPSSTTALLGNGTWGAVTTSPAGSTGQVQINNAGAFGAVSSGTTGQVLTSQGSGAAPVFATPAGGGSWIHLSTVTASNSATVDIETTFDSTYQVYALTISNIRASITNALLRMRNKLGSTYISSSDYIYHLNRSNSGQNTYTGFADTESSYRLGMFMSNETFNSGQFIVYIHNPASTTSFKSIYSVGAFANVVASHANMAGYCGVGNTQPLTGLRFFFESANIVDGTFRLYGIKNS